MAATDLPGGPAQQQWLARGLAVKDEALCFTGLRQQWIMGGKFRQSGKRGLLTEGFQDQFLRSRSDAATASEDGFAAGG